MFNIGTRIVVASMAQGNDPGPAGTVVGFAHFQSEHTGQIEPAYLVRLDQGVWTEDRFAFINIIVVHPCNVEEPEHD